MSRTRYCWREVSSLLAGVVEGRARQGAGTSQLSPPHGKDGGEESPESILLVLDSIQTLEQETAVEGVDLSSPSEGPRDLYSLGQHLCRSTDLQPLSPVQSHLLPLVLVCVCAHLSHHCIKNEVYFSLVCLNYISERPLDPSQI